jgi:hypothetical protein
MIPSGTPGESAFTGGLSTTMTPTSPSRSSLTSALSLMTFPSFSVGAECATAPRERKAGA